MASLKLISWNCQGLRSDNSMTSQKMAFLETQYSQRPFDVLSLLETHHRNESDFPSLITAYKLRHHIIHTPVHPDDTYGGIILLINKTFTIISTDIPVQGRIITVTLQHTITKQDFVLTAYYGIHFRTISQMTPFFDALKLHHSTQTNSFIIGDFNFVHSDLDRKDGMNAIDKRTLKHWQPLQHSLLLTDPYRFLYPKTRIYSYTSRDKKPKSRIDRIYISEHNLKNVNSYKYIATPFFDHKIQEMTYRLNIPFGKSLWKMNTTVLPDKKYQAIITTLIEHLDTLPIPNKVTWWEVFLTSVKSYTIQYTKDKHYVKNKLKYSITQQLDKFHALDSAGITPHIQSKIDYLQEQLKQLQLDEIAGYLVRSRIPKFEDKEPKIAYYANLEKKHAKSNMISILTDTNNDECTQHPDLLRITHNYYTQLYKQTTTDSQIQNQLLQKIHTQATPQQNAALNAPITLSELTNAIEQLPREKTPGRDGIPIEFYQHFWGHIQDHYLEYINEAHLIGFKDTRNKGLIKLIYKNKGDPKDLYNYRPISLLNCDLKILTKTLANRLKQVLPTIIHKTQTAVDGRKIDNTIHMTRDLIQLAENENMTAGFIFLDQEKAFDRVNHEFLFTVMKRYNLGTIFINWIKQLYRNATTTVLINGYQTDTIPLTRGVRQGCPISSLLYVLVIEILALQLRQNQNIVGFQIGGEKIVSMHYADDAVIVIKQNQCFKEVYKELTDYEQATGAKVNLTKTKGLWLGAWKNRTDTPLGLQWTNTNVENLGVFFGNDNPELHTFQKIVTKIEKSLAYWKLFYLSKLAKSRIIEIFIASKLWYASKFYCIPKLISTYLQTLFTDYINWPHKRNTVAQTELFKLRQDGGIKLIHIESKSFASKIMWLKQLILNPTLDHHLQLVYKLLGVQKGHKQGLELFFVPRTYAQRIFKFKSPFYKEAIISFAHQDVQQHITNNDVLVQQNIYYNRIFLDLNNKPLPITARYDRDRILAYHVYINEDLKQRLGQVNDRYIVNVFKKIKKTVCNFKEYAIETQVKGYLPLRQLTEKIMYHELLYTHYRDHHSSERWIRYFPELLEWDHIWQNCHNILATERTKTIIWEQLHLNYFTQYCYNVAHNLSDVCPLCNQIPLNRMHIVLLCPFTIQMWQDIQPYIHLIHPVVITEFEMAFGIVGTKPEILLRNWLTFKLRECITKQEHVASLHPQVDNALQLKKRMNQQIHQEVVQKYYYTQHTLKHDFFTKHYQFTDNLIRISQCEIAVADIFNI